jgi:hexosaminidase
MNVRPQCCLHSIAKLSIVAATLSLLFAPAHGQPSIPSAGPAGNTLMPLPAKLEPRQGLLPIEGSFSYSLNGDTGARVSQGVKRLIDRMETRTGVSMSRAPVAAGAAATLTINVQTAPTADVPQPGVDESYTLDINAQNATLRAQTDIGALRGMETLLQLVEASGSGYAFPGVHIEDAPRFPWRGLMLDAGRHFLPVANVLRTLDGMAAVKLNVLHWHLSEDQGFRVESLVFPKLQQLGSNGQYYTQQQIREVIAYASARGIRVVPEFDMPGHAQSWMVGYPQIGSAPGPFAISDKFGVMDAAMDPTRESTYEFLDQFLGEMAELFPDPYLHIGGDESNGKEWKANPDIRAYMAAHGMKTTAELQAYFSTRVQKILTAHHKQMVGWDEILSPTLPQDAVIQNWHGIEFLMNAAKLGHRGFLSHPYYLDHTYTAGDMYLADPLPAGNDLTPEQAALIQGGEACMWGEQLTAVTIDSRIWPRTAAVAERFWSPAHDRDVNDMYRRLDVETLRLEGEGLMHMSGPVRVMHNMVGTTHVQPLELFLATLQPVDFPVRSRIQKPSTATVYDRVVDAARIDPPMKHDFQILVDRAIGGDKASADRLDSLFHSWVAAAPALDALEANSPLLQEAASHIAAWPKLGTMGEEALQYLRTGTAPPAGWQEKQNAVFQEAVKPSELVEFVILDPMKKLVNATSARESESKKSDAIHAYLQHLVDTHTIAGAVTLVSTRYGTIYLEPVGFRDLATKEPMKADDLFWIASVSKPMTASAFMMLWDEKKVDLSAPVETYLPEFHGQQVYRTRPDAKAPATASAQASDLVAADHPILVSEILSHTSGLPFKSAAQPGALDLLPLKDAVKSYAAEPLLFQPFTDYSYSNEGLNTAARILEVVSGMPYEQFLQQRLFGPLGMKDTTFWPGAAQSARIATTYKLSKQTAQLSATPVDQLTYPLSDHAHRYPMPAGGLFSTAADMERFCRMILNGGTLDGKHYLSPEAIGRMTTRENNGFRNTDYGFGWTVTGDSFGHGGAYKNAIDINPVTGRILVFMVQQNGDWGTPEGNEILSTLKRLANELPDR